MTSTRKKGKNLQEALNKPKKRGTIINSSDESSCDHDDLSYHSDFSAPGGSTATGGQRTSAATTVKSELAKAAESSSAVALTSARNSESKGRAGRGLPQDGHGDHEGSKNGGKKQENLAGIDHNPSAQSREERHGLENGRRMQARLGLSRGLAESHHSVISPSPPSAAMEGHPISGWRSAGEKGDDQEMLREQLQRLVSKKLETLGDLDPAGMMALETLSKMPPAPGTAPAADTASGGKALKAASPSSSLSSEALARSRSSRRVLPPGLERVPIFSGKDPSTLTDTLNRFHAIVTTALPGSPLEAVNRALLRDVVFVLEGSALKFYNALKQGLVEWEPHPPTNAAALQAAAASGGPPHRPPTTWIHVCEAFHDHFLPSEGIARTTAALLSLRQAPDEPVPSLAARQLGLSHHLNRLIDAQGGQTGFWEAISIGLFEQALRGGLARAQHTEPACSSFQESVDRAERNASKSAPAGSAIARPGAPSAVAPLAASAPANGSIGKIGDVMRGVLMSTATREKNVPRVGTDQAITQKPVGAIPPPEVAIRKELPQTISPTRGKAPVVPSHTVAQKVGDKPSAGVPANDFVQVKCEVPGVRHENERGRRTADDSPTQPEGSPQSKLNSQRTSNASPISRSHSTVGNDHPISSTNVAHDGNGTSNGTSRSPPLPLGSSESAHMLSDDGMAPFLADGVHDANAPSLEFRLMSSPAWRPKERGGRRGVKGPGRGRGESKPRGGGGDRRTTGEARIIRDGGRSCGRRGDGAPARQMSSPSVSRKGRKRCREDLHVDGADDDHDAHVDGGYYDDDGPPHFSPYPQFRPHQQQGRGPNAKVTPDDRPPCTLVQCKSINRQFHSASDCFYHPEHGERNRKRAKNGRKRHPALNGPGSGAGSLRRSDTFFDNNGYGGPAPSMNDGYPGIAPPYDDGFQRGIPFDAGYPGPHFNDGFNGQY